MGHKGKAGSGNRSNAAGEKSYTVGYGRPPTSTQFRRGISGNPKGRRKKPPTFSEVTEQVLNKKVDMRIGDRVLRMTNREALVQAGVRQALAGKPRLLGVLPGIMRYEDERQQGRAETGLNLAPEDEAILADFLARNRASEDSGNGDPT